MNADNDIKRRHCLQRRHLFSLCPPSICYFTTSTCRLIVPLQVREKDRDTHTEREIRVLKRNQIHQRNMPLEDQVKQQKPPFVTAPVVDNPFELDQETKGILLCIVLIVSFMALGYVYYLSKQQDYQYKQEEEKKRQKQQHKKAE